MVLGIPISKLVAEIFKAVTKPMVNSLKRNVQKSPFWKDRLFIPMAQGYNLTSVRVRLWTQGISRNKEQIERSAKMSDEAALELGAEMVANFVTFILGLMAIILQQSIASTIEKKKEEEELSENERINKTLLDLNKKIVDLGSTAEKLELNLEELNRTVLLMKTNNKPFSSARQNHRKIEN